MNLLIEGKSYGAFAQLLPIASSQSSVTASPCSISSIQQLVPEPASEVGIIERHHAYSIDLEGILLAM